MTWLLATAILLGGAVFFALRAATQGRLQVEAVLGRMSGYGYAPAPSGSDPRAWLRKIGYVAPGGPSAQPLIACVLGAFAGGLGCRLFRALAAGNLGDLEPRNLVAGVVRHLHVRQSFR